MKARLKTWIKQLTYSKGIQEIISLLIFGYIQLVYLTSKKSFIGQEAIHNSAKENKPIIISIWHNRLMMAAFFAKKTNSIYKNYKFMSLASKHGDGRFVGKVMAKFNIISILGSTIDPKNPQRGISYSSLKQIITGLKNNQCLGITPDGPRGPNQKINSEIISIARLSGSPIACCSIAYSRYIEMNSWDKFKLPLPFGKIVFYTDNKLVTPAKKLNETQLAKANQDLEKQMNQAQISADKAIS